MRSAAEYHDDIALPPAGSERLRFAARQIGTVIVTLALLRAVTNGVRPDAAGARDVVSAPYLWSIVLWIVLIVFSAYGFERPQTAELEGPPLAAAVIVGLVSVVVGAVTFDSGATVERLVFVLLNSLGVTLFWWAVLGLELLLWLRVTTDSRDSR